ncbi:predicted protein [Histoplasma capsulatum H143]|uniref:NACHT domain-containing protein n=1 Tax=Ajellomyces capsulatus (strain H143) TaxID=544712 RepID=C6H4D3_AJECH|nr:predicted protein [Histoplasma capsulatum H143]
MISRGSEEKIKEEILESLYHPNMHYQREWISSAHKKTFNWTRRIKPVTESHPESPSGSGPTLHYSTHRKKPSLRLKFCFLIDALDEFDGDHQSLVDLLTLKEGRNVLIYTIADAAVPAAERTANRFQVELNLH